jgi:plastocyanin
MKESYSRRQFVAGVSVASAVALAGCGGSGGDGGGETPEPAAGGGGDTTTEATTEADGGGETTTESGGGGGENVVAAGPNEELVFDPESITVSTGDTVTWEFESANHNVAAYPDMHEQISIPDSAEGFGTMEEGGDKFATVPEGETFEHTFETTGEFTYVCVPHASAGMVGTVVVE